MVAEVTITRSSGRRAHSRFKRPQQQVDVEAALVRLIDDQGVVSRQLRIECQLTQQDAIGHEFDRQCGPVRSSKRTWQPTAAPTRVPSSAAIRLASARAAMRRGWVWPIMPCVPRPAARHSLGNCVDLPEPGRPAHDDDRVRGQGSRYVRSVGADGQLWIGHQVQGGTLHRARILAEHKALVGTGASAYRASYCNLRVPRGGSMTRFITLVRAGSGSGAAGVRPSFLRAVRSSEPRHRRGDRAEVRMDQSACVHSA